MMVSAGGGRAAWMAGTSPRLSGWILLGKAHGIDSNHFQSLATRLDMKRISAVPHTNTVFRDILKLLPWSAFERLVEEHGTDELVRSFTTKRQLLALLCGTQWRAGKFRTSFRLRHAYQGTGARACIV